MEKSRYLVIVILLLTYSCSTESIDNSKHRSPVSPKKGKISSDSCSFCQLDSLVVEQTEEVLQADLTFSTPVAIELFDNTKLMHKYNNKDGYDTLMKLFKMHNWADRNEIYRLMDQEGYYKTGFKNALVSYSVIIIDTIHFGRLVRFKDNAHEYNIDLQKLRQEDGVLMFNPGKIPIFWTMDKEVRNCLSLNGLPLWYFNCH